MAEMTPCKYGDPTCPCQDGDLCHYEGDNPMNMPPEYVRAAVQAEREACLSCAEAFDDDITARTIANMIRARSKEDGSFIHQSAWSIVRSALIEGAWQSADQTHFVISEKRYRQICAEFDIDPQQDIRARGKEEGC